MDTQTPSTPSTKDLNNATPDLEPLLAGLKSNDPLQQLSSSKSLTNLLETNNNVICDTANTVVPLVVQLLTSEKEDLQYESSRVIALITFGDSSQLQVVAKTAVPVLLKIFRSAPENTQQQAALALGNIAAHSSQHRKQILQRDATPGFWKVIGKILDSTEPAEVLRALKTMNGLLNAKAKLRDATGFLVASLVRLTNSNNEETLEQVYCALKHLADVADSSDTVQIYIDSGICKSLVEISSQGKAYSGSTLRNVANLIANGDENQTQYILDLGVLPCLSKLLQSNSLTDDLQTDISWTVSNICASDPKGIQAAMDAGLVAPLIQLLPSAKGAQLEIAWVISNITQFGTPGQVGALIALDFLKPLCQLLTSEDYDIKQVVLDTLSRMIAKGEEEAARSGGANRVIQLIQQANGVQLIRGCQMKPTEFPYPSHKTANNLLKTYFSEQ